MTDQSSDERPTRASDVPLDLVKERESFVRNFLKKGVEYTETLLEENTELRDENTQLRADNAQLRAQVASDDAIRDLLRTVERLEAERKNLLDQSERLEQSRSKHEVRVNEIEQEVNDLANLYIASYQLHAGMSVRRVMRHLGDMCGQLMGAHRFVIYLLDDARQKAELLYHENAEGVDLDPVVYGEGPIGDAMLTGMERIREATGEALRHGSREDPVAVIPLMVEGQAVGAIAIFELLEQKERWASVDRELQQLLKAHAAPALITANLFAATDGVTDALRGLRDKL